MQCARVALRLPGRVWSRSHHVCACSLTCLLSRPGLASVLQRAVPQRGYARALWDAGEVPVLSLAQARDTLGIGCVPDCRPGRHACALSKLSDGHDHPSAAAVVDVRENDDKEKEEEEELENAEHVSHTKDGDESDAEHVRDDPVTPAALHVTTRTTTTRTIAAAAQEQEHAAEFAVLDTEGTSLSPSHTRIIELAAIGIRQTREVERFESLVNPGTPIPRHVTVITGIDDAMVQGAPAFPDLAAPLDAVLQHRAVLAHNAAFDRAVLAAELERAGITDAAATRNTWLCTLKLSRRMLPGLASYRLQDMAQELRLPQPESQHRAGADALTTLHLWERLHAKICSATGLTRVSHALVDAVQSAPTKQVPRLLRRVATHGEAAGLQPRSSTGSRAAGGGNRDASRVRWAAIRSTLRAK